MSFVDDADDCRVYRRAFVVAPYSRRAALSNEYEFAYTCAYLVDRDYAVIDFKAGDRFDYHEFIAYEVVALSRGYDRPDDFAYKHK